MEDKEKNKGEAVVATGTIHIRINPAYPTPSVELITFAWTEVGFGNRVVVSANPHAASVIDAIMRGHAEVTTEVVLEGDIDARAT